jgi:N-acetylglucosaminyldiphosphoundecaprenol N-acetyl-beta-D-mannosaminyltransferase
MSEIMAIAIKHRLRTMILGASQDLADKLARCQNEKAGEKLFFGERGFETISFPTEDENKSLFSKITELKPQIIFAAFGSPEQELWFWHNRARFNGILCMGVGGSVDFLTGKVPRAPGLIRSLGLEWLYRLMRQPWRVVRQRRLLTFISLILRQKPCFVSSS